MTLTKTLLKESVGGAVKALERQRKELLQLKAALAEQPELQRLVVNSIIDGYLAAAQLGTDLVAEEMALEQARRILG